MGAYTPIASADGGTAAPLTIKIDEVSTSLSYIGKAPSGSSVSAAVWQISRLASPAGAYEIAYADFGQYSQVWNDRASLTYTT